MVRPVQETFRGHLLKVAGIMRSLSSASYTTMYREVQRGAAASRAPPPFVKLVELGGALTC